LLYIVEVLWELGWTFSLKALKEMLAFGLPLVPAGVAAIILTMSDRYFLRYYADCTEVGLYSLGYKLATVVSLIVGAFQTAWPAVLFSTAKKKKAPSIFSELFTYFFFFLMFLAVSISVLAKEIVALMATSVFHTGYRVVPLIALSYVLYGCYHMTAVGVNVKRKTYYIPFVMGGAALLNLLLNYLLIPRYGMMGAAEATVISYMFMVMVAAKISLHLYHVPYEYVRIGKILSVALIVYGLSLLVRTDRILLATMVKVILILGYPGLLYVMRFYRRAELMHIKEVVLRSIGREQGDKGR
jgi:O-antigen/teichoic acid export membrane protein